jgi:hypothetical protein
MKYSAFAINGLHVFGGDLLAADAINAIGQTPLHFLS